jgi:hypothetical protein
MEVEKDRKKYEVNRLVDRLRGLRLRGLEKFPRFDIRRFFAETHVLSPGLHKFEEVSTVQD